MYAREKGVLYICWLLKLRAAWCILIHLGMYWFEITRYISNKKIGKRRKIQLQCSFQDCKFCWENLRLDISALKLHVLATVVKFYLTCFSNDHSFSPVQMQILKIHNVEFACYADEILFLKEIWWMLCFWVILGHLVKLHCGHIISILTCQCCNVVKGIFWHC